VSIAIALNTTAALAKEPKCEWVYDSKGKNGICVRDDLKGSPAERQYLVEKEKCRKSPENCDDEPLKAIRVLKLGKHPKPKPTAEKPKPTAGQCRPGYVLGRNRQCGPGGQCRPGNVLGRNGQCRRA
jgi:hypothetical protein